MSDQSPAMVSTHYFEIKNEYALLHILTVLGFRQVNTAAPLLNNAFPA